MEEEAEKLKQMQSEVNKQMTLGSPTGIVPLTLSSEEKKEIDDRSVYVGNVDYGATAEELEAHFHGCGSMNRVTILCNKVDGHPKGFAYIEFGSKDFVETALAMNDTLFRGRQIKVSQSVSCFSVFGCNLFNLFILNRLCQSGPIDPACRPQTDSHADSEAATVGQAHVADLVVVTDPSVAPGDQRKLSSLKKQHPRTHLHIPFSCIKTLQNTTKPRPRQHSLPFQ